MRLTGGCQCGAVRYEILEAPDHASICHCRMCQKATGQAYLASATVPLAALRWTRGTPGSFRSSSVATREFCRDCGTPLVWRDVGTGEAGVSLGTLDDPEAVAPDRQIGIEARRSWWAGASLTDGQTTDDYLAQEADRAEPIVSYQHPDHDTAHWPPDPAARQPAGV